MSQESHFHDELAFFSNCNWLGIANIFVDNYDDDIFTEIKLKQMAIEWSINLCIPLKKSTRN